MSSFTLSDTVIILICGAGVVLVVSIVLCLILCITSKKKDHVRVIHLSNRPRPNHPRESRPRRTEMPKPPPYSELPPEYSDSHRQTLNIHRETTQTRPATTRAVNVSLHRTSSIRTRHGSPHPNASARERNSHERGETSHPNSHRNGTNSRHIGAIDNDNMRNVAQIPSTSNDYSNMPRHQVQQHARSSGQAILLNPVQSSSNSFQTRNRHFTNPPSNLLPGEAGSGISPPPTTRAGELRSAQRRQAIVTIENRRMQRMTASPPPAYEQIAAI